MRVKCDFLSGEVEYLRSQLREVDLNQSLSRSFSVEPSFLLSTCGGDPAKKCRCTELEGRCAQLDSEVERQLHKAQSAEQQLDAAQGLLRVILEQNEEDRAVIEEEVLLLQAQLGCDRNHLGATKGSCSNAQEKASPLTNSASGQPSWQHKVQALASPMRLVWTPQKSRVSISHGSESFVGSPLSLEANPLRQSAGLSPAAMMMVSKSERLNTLEFMGIEEAEISEEARWLHTLSPGAPSREQQAHVLDIMEQMLADRKVFMEEIAHLQVALAEAHEDNRLLVTELTRLQTQLGELQV